MVRAKDAQLPWMAIEKMLREHLSKVTGHSWSEISSQLCKTMYSEYESTKV